MPHLSPLTSHFSPRPSAWLHNPSLSIWLSVDPLSDKYPGVSPYVYCANNPVVLKDPNGRDIAPSNKEGQQAIENYFSKFSQRILDKVFNLQKSSHTDSRNGSYTTYSSSESAIMSEGAFFKKVGNLSPDEKQEAYAVYLALKDEGLYTVGVWGGRKEGESYTYSLPKTISEGTVLCYSVPGYATPAVEQNRAYDSDLDAIKEGNFPDLFSVENHSKYNGEDIFTNEFNYYKNYSNQKFNNNYEINRGCLIFNGTENTIHFGNAFRRIFYY